MSNDPRLDMAPAKPLVPRTGRLGGRAAACAVAGVLGASVRVRDRAGGGQPATAGLLVRQAVEAGRRKLAAAAALA